MIVPRYEAPERVVTTSGAPWPAAIAGRGTRRAWQSNSVRTNRDFMVVAAFAPGAPRFHCMQYATRSAVARELPSPLAAMHRSRTVLSFVLALVSAPSFF